jgi:hypothetical protein
MGNPETLVTLGTQDTGQRIEKTQGQIKNGQFRDTGSIGYTRHRTKDRENPRANQEWAIQRHWQHWVHKTQDKDKQNKTHNISLFNNTRSPPYIEIPTFYFKQTYTCTYLNIDVFSYLYSIASSCRSNNLQRGIPMSIIVNRIGVVICSVLASSVVDRGFKAQSGQTKHYKTGICCFSARHAWLRRKSKDWSARNQGNMSERVTCLSADCCFSELALWKSNQACQSGTKGTSSSYQCKVSLFSPWYSWTIAELALNNYHLLTL